MKNLSFIFGAVIALCVSMTACAKKGDNAVQESTKKVLVAYFSATGTTAEVAQMIAVVTAGELYEIQPAGKYTDEDLDWTVETSRSTVEMHDNNARPAIVKNKADLDAYDIIYLGYPNWWNQAPRIINTFVEAYSLKGKTVIPFMTSGGSRIDNSVSLLRKAYPDVNWQDGKLLNGVSQSDVDDWVKNNK